MTEPPMTPEEQRAFVRLQKASEAVENELWGLRLWKADLEIRNGEWEVEFDPDAPPPRSAPTTSIDEPDD